MSISSIHSLNRLVICNKSSNHNAVIMHPLPVAQFNQYIFELTINPSRELFHSTVVMLNSAFVAGRLVYPERRVYVIPAETFNNFVYLKPFVTELSKAYRKNNGIHYRNDDIAMLNKFENQISMEPDCCTQVVMWIFDWIIRKC